MNDATENTVNSMHLNNNHGALFSFSDIVRGHNASAVRVTNDGFLYAVDLVMAMTGQSRDDAGKTLNRINPSNFQLNEKILERQSLSTFDGHTTKLITFEHAIELVMILPGETAKETRVGFANVIRRYLARNKSLINEVEQNANSGESISQMARDSITSDKKNTEKRIFRKRGLEQDGTLMQLIINDKKQKILMQEIELKEKHTITFMKSLDLQKTIIDTYTPLCENRVLDADAKLLFKENILKLAYHSVLVGWDNTTDSMNACT